MHLNKGAVQISHIAAKLRPAKNITW